MQIHKSDKLQAPYFSNLGDTASPLSRKLTESASETALTFSQDANCSIVLTFFHYSYVISFICYRRSLVMTFILIYIFMNK